MSYLVHQILNIVGSHIEIERIFNIDGVVTHLQWFWFQIDNLDLFILIIKNWCNDVHLGCARANEKTLIFLLLHSFVGFPFVLVLFMLGDFTSIFFFFSFGFCWCMGTINEKSFSWFCYFFGIWDLIFQSSFIFLSWFCWCVGQQLDAWEFDVKKVFCSFVVMLLHGSSTIVMTFLVRECYGSPKIFIKFVKIRQNSLKFTLEECYDKVLNEKI